MTAATVVWRRTLWLDIVVLKHISSEQDSRLFRFSSASSKAVLVATTCSRYSTAELLHDPECHNGIDPPDDDVLR